MKKRQKPQIIEYILAKDEILTTHLVNWFLKMPQFRVLKHYSLALEVSCNGIAWLAGWLAYTWIANSESLAQMQLNMLFGLVLDIIIIAILKAAVRRRRPIRNDSLTIGPDKFSFPSGHASRSTFVFLFFCYLYPIFPLFLLPLFAWAACVCLSRLLIQRHYIIDVICGSMVGVLEVMLLWLFWISESTAISLFKSLSDDFY